MITLAVSVILLVIGYLTYSKTCERIFGADDDRPTPAIAQADGVDFVTMPRWRVFMVQFINIAGLGPIFGAVAGAMWGPVAFLWIVVGCLVAGGVHDYFSGMLSLRNGGQSFSELSGQYLGNGIKQFMRVFTFVLLIMVGVVFLVGPANILHQMFPNNIFTVSVWTGIILCYYILSTILPIDKLVGRLYPVFGIVLLFMALSILSMTVYKGLPVPELTIEGFSNMHLNKAAMPIFPMLFVTIACGAVSGFHATQSPLMARCIKKEKDGRPVFFGTMVTEGVVALIWAAVSMSYFGGVRELNVFMTDNGGNASLAVNEICTKLLGGFGGTLALIGVVVAPISSGDTAFRSARVLVADAFGIAQRRLINRLVIAIPIFLLAFGISLLDFGVVWRYFAWTNQTLATIVLWTITVYLIGQGKNYWVALLPATFMTNVVVSYILLAPEGLALPHGFSYTCGLLVSVGLLLCTFYRIYRKGKYGNLVQD